MSYWVKLESWTVLCRTIFGVPLTWRRWWSRFCDADTLRSPTAVCRWLYHGIIPEGPIRTEVAARGLRRSFYSSLHIDREFQWFNSWNSSVALSFWCHCLISNCLTICSARYQDKLCNNKIKTIYWTWGGAVMMVISKICCWYDSPWIWTVRSNYYVTMLFTAQLSDGFSMAIQNFADGKFNFQKNSTSGEI